MSESKKVNSLIFQSTDAAKLLPERKDTDNKTNGGKCLVVAGSDDFFGASLLTCKAAARVGAGYVYLATEANIQHLPEAPDIILKTDVNKNEFNDYSAVAIGPGLTRSDFIKKFLSFLLDNHPKKCVLDAEALNVIAKSNNDYKFSENTVMTPHEGELSRLLSVDAEKIKANRYQYALEAQQKYNCVVLLKGHKTLVAKSDLVYEVQTGNPALAKAGTGDVLTGMIAGFLSQGLDAYKAASLAAFVHGIIADQWIEGGNDVLSLMASDLIQRLPMTLADLRSTD